MRIYKRKRIHFTLNNKQIMLPFFMVQILAIITFISSIAWANACDQWFLKLKITTHENCLDKCVVAMTDMSSFGCPSQCDSLCKKVTTADDETDQLNYYGLTNDEVKFCTENKTTCLKAYKLSWDTEKICLSVYPQSLTNDESDACRHYVWSNLLSRDIGLKDAETILNAHENNPKEPADEKAMDLANNRLGLIDFQKNKKITDIEIINSFKQNLKNKSLVILKPRYPTTGGLP